MPTPASPRGSRPGETMTFNVTLTAPSSDHGDGAVSDPAADGDRRCGLRARVRHVDVPPGVTASSRSRSGVRRYGRRRSTRRSPSTWRPGEREDRRRQGRRRRLWTTTDGGSARGAGDVDVAGRRDRARRGHDQGASDGWNAGAASAQALLDGDGSMEFTDARRIRSASPGSATATPTRTTPTSTSVSSCTQGRVFVVESGVEPRRRSAATRSPTDSPWRSRAAWSSIGRTACRSTRARSRRPIRCSSTRRSSRLAATLVDVVLSGRLARPVTWTNLAGVSAAGGIADEDRRRRLECGRGVDACARLRRRFRRVHRDGDEHDADAGAEPRQRQHGLDATSTSAFTCDSNATVYVVESGRHARRLRELRDRRSIPGRGRGGPGRLPPERRDALYERAWRRRIRCWWMRRCSRRARRWRTSRCAGTFATDVTFAGAVGVSASGNTLTKSAAHWAGMRARSRRARW